MSPGVSMGNVTLGRSTIPSSDVSATTTPPAPEIIVRPPGRSVAIRPGAAASAANARPARSN